MKPDFLVSPAFSQRVLDAALEAKIPYIPAVHTFQDVQDVIDAFDDRGVEVRLLKLCPVYGLTRDYVRSLCGCFPGIVFCPTGEITLENYYDWKSTPGIVTSWAAAWFQAVAGSGRLAGGPRPAPPAPPLVGRGCGLANLDDAGSTKMYRSSSPPLVSTSADARTAADSAPAAMGVRH